MTDPTERAAQAPAGSVSHRSDGPKAIADLTPSGDKKAYAGTGDGAGGELGKKTRRKKRSRRRSKERAHSQQNPQNISDISDIVVRGSSGQPNPVQSPAAAPLKANRGAQNGPSHKNRPKKRNAPRHTKNRYQSGYAALDLGTNNCRLLVAVPTKPGQFRVVDAYSRIVRLGEGLSQSGQLSQNAMDRAVEALKICSQKLVHPNIKKARLVATEACRSAENGFEFLSRVEAETGLQLEIVDRKTEAQLAVAGCASLVDKSTNGIVLFDIGGGSSEIALCDLSKHRGPKLEEHIVAWTSLPIGVVSLAERFDGKDVTPEVYANMVDWVVKLLDDFEDSHLLDHLMGTNDFHLIGTSGTVTTLAGVLLGLKRYDRSRVDGLWMTNEQVTSTTDKLLSLDFEARKANPCIGSERADLVLAGCAILDAIRYRWPAPRLRVADRGLREGILTGLMSRDGVWRRSRRSRKPQVNAPQANSPQDRNTNG